MKLTAKQFLVALASSLASVAAFADGAALPDLTGQLTAMGTAVQTQATSQAGAVAPFVLFVVAVLVVFGIAKKLFKKIG
ncbi:hypothetical protein BI343_09275 [Chromobacterium amazonense]|uniref:hypothetical protein n=1 Tax=Chromobacterium amazonense TaxID=1382803 RepID=UPI0008D9066D|nr:hypothetical protein [Chromobacterium amazonense]OHX18394.1 hypothetical protein BI343_09275 [Chromobacterium amazonense]